MVRFLCAIFIFRFNTVDGVNKEYSLDWNEYSDGFFSFSSDQAFSILNSIPVDSLFPLSPFEIMKGYKCWWTIEIEEQILLQEDHTITVTYFSLLSFYQLEQMEIFLFLLMVRRY